MDDKEREQMLVSALGEAAFAAVGQEALWRLAVRKRLVSKDEAKEVWDLIILGIQQNCQNAPGAQFAVPDYAIARAEHFLKSLDDS